MDRLRVLLAPLIAAISLVAWMPSALAQSAEAEALFTEGDNQMKAGKLAEACDAFEASNKLEARAGTLIRLGECREKNGQLASAWSAYKDALTRVKDPKKKAIAQGKVDELEPKLSYLTITVGDASKLNGLALVRNDKPLDPVLWNRGMPVNGGDFTIVARAPGRTEWKTTVKVPVEKGKITVDVPVLADPKAVKAVTVTKVEPTPVSKVEPTPPVVGQSDGAALVVDEPVDTTPTPSSFTTKRKIALGLGGVAALGIVGGVVLGKAAKTKEDDAFSLCPDPAMPCADAMRADALIDSARSKALTANIAFGVAGAAAIGAAVLWFTGAPSTSETSVAIVPSAHSTTIAVSGRF